MIDTHSNVFSTPNISRSQLTLSVAGWKLDLISSAAPVFGNTSQPRLLTVQ